MTRMKNEIESLDELENILVEQEKSLSEENIHPHYGEDRVVLNMGRKKKNDDDDYDDEDDYDEIDDEDDDVFEDEPSDEDELYEEDFDFDEDEDLLDDDDDEVPYN
jgi:hypothetical protein